MPTVTAFQLETGQPRRRISGGRYVAWLFRAVPAVVVSVVALMFSAAEANAVCGDYVVYGPAGSAQRELGHLGAMGRPLRLIIGEEQRPGGAMGPGDSAPASPCEGPSCEGDLPGPQTPMPAPVRDFSGQYLVELVAAASLPGARPVGWLMPSQRRFTSPGHLRPVEPPPRFRSDCG